MDFFVVALLLLVSPSSFCDSVNVPTFLFLQTKIFQVAGFVTVEALLVGGPAAVFRVAAATVLAITGLAFRRYC